MKWKVCLNCGNENLKRKTDSRGNQIYDCFECDSQWTKDYLKKESIKAGQHE